MLQLPWSSNKRAEGESPAELLWHLFTAHFQARSLRCTNQNWIQKGLLEPGEKCIQMGFLLDWLHFPTLLSNGIDQPAVSVHPRPPIGFRPPFSLSLFTLESFQGYLYYTVLGVRYDFVASYFITRMSPWLLVDSKTRIMRLRGFSRCLVGHRAF